jgi:hypothetical protein
MKTIILFFILGVSVVTLNAQPQIEKPPQDIKTNKLYFGIETGFSTFNSSNNEYDFIREEATYFGYYNGYSEITLSSYAPRLSIKAEYRAIADKLWLSTGIAYSSMSSFFSKSENSQTQNDFFYLMLRQSQNESDYYRINEIDETIYYIGIPVDIRYSPFLPRFFRLYFKVGFDLNFKVATKQSIDFYDVGMKKHEKAILELFDQPGNFYADGNFGVGFQLGKQNKPNFRIEAEFPSLVLNPKTFGLVTHDFGGGCSLSFLIPLK